MKDYDFERPDSDFPGYDDYFTEGENPDLSDEEVFEDDYPDEF